MQVRTFSVERCLILLSWQLQLFGRVENVLKKNVEKSGFKKKMKRWEKVESEEGTYFFNPETGETSWTNPTPDDNDTASLHELVSLDGYVDDAAIENAIKRGDDVNSKNSEGEAPIHVACRSGYTSAMYYILLNGASIDSKTSDGRTVLHCCVYAKEYSLESLNYLESSFRVTKKVDVNHRDRAGRTVLHHAAIQGDENVCMWLIQKGANPTMRDAGLMTPSDLALRSNQKSCADALKLNEEKFSVRNKFGHLKIKTKSSKSATISTSSLKAKSHSPRGSKSKRRGPQVMLTPLASSSSKKSSRSSSSAAPAAEVETTTEELSRARESAKLAKKEYDNMKKRLEHSAREI